MVWVVAAVLGVLALLRLTGGDDSGAASPVRIDSGPSAGVGASGGRARSRRIYVHVAGAVARPGLVRLPAESRVATAVERAGGPARGADLTAVNLAARLEDGQQVVVPVRGAENAGDAAGASAGALAGAKPSLGVATTDQLDEVDGIGPTLAERIVEYRTENGGFRSLGELREVEGIGEKRFASLSEALQP